MSITVILVQAIHWFTYILIGLIVVNVLLSWLRLSPNSPVVRVVTALTEPILGPIRRVLAKSPLGGPGMPLDFSPLLAYLLIEFCGNLLTALVTSLRLG